MFEQITICTHTHTLLYCGRYLFEQIHFRMSYIWGCSIPCI